MALEDLTGSAYLSALVRTNPELGDDIEQGDDHLRGIKNVLLNTFPNLTAAVTKTAAELNAPYPTVPTGADALPLLNDAAASIGTSPQWAREDHRHGPAGLGYGGQSWQGVTRTKGSNYTNDTGRPIAINVHATIDTTYAYLTLTIGGTAIGGSATASSTYASIFGIVPAGAVYSWNTSAGGATNITVRELR